WVGVYGVGVGDLCLREGAALDPKELTDRLAMALARNLREGGPDSEVALARGEHIAFGRFTVSQDGVELDGVRTNWAVFGWGRRPNDRWEPARLFGLGRTRSEVRVSFPDVNLPEGRRCEVPTREIDNYLVFEALRIP